MTFMAQMKKSKISISDQIRLLQYYFPDSQIQHNKNKGFTWLGKLKSSPLGDTYTIKIVFEKKVSPAVYVVDPAELKLAEDKTKLEHVYNHKKQKLCLFYPDGSQWNDSKMVASTIIPWTIEWLYHYEIWLITGKWLGGGKHPNSSDYLNKVKSNI